MAERGKAEESQRTEAGNLDAELVDEMLAAVREAMQRLGVAEASRRSRAVDVRFRSTGADPSDVEIVVEAKAAPSEVKIQAGQHLIQMTSRVNRPGTDLLPELDEPVERDDAYYDEVRQAVGRGAPSVLLGTSTKSLERGLEKLWVVHGAGGASQTASRPSRGTARVHPFRRLYGRLFGRNEEATVVRWDGGPDLPPHPAWPGERSSTEESDRGR